MKMNMTKGLDLIIDSNQYIGYCVIYKCGFAVISFTTSFELPVGYDISFRYCLVNIIARP